MRPFIILVLLCAFSTLQAQSPSRSVFFVENEGQWPGEFSFKYNGGGGTWFVTDQGLTIDLKQYIPSERSTQLAGSFNHDPFGDRERDRDYSIRGHVLKANLVGAPHAAPVLEGQDKLASCSNYFLGKDKSMWRGHVGHYQKVVAHEVWSGIDVEYAAKKEGVETIFRCQPEADVSQIQIEYEGLDAPLSLDSKGNLVLKTSLGSLIEKAPFAYQIENRRQKEVPVHFELTGNNSYRLSVNNYNHNRELVIDPFLYGTYLGGPGLEDAEDVYADPNGGFVVCGYSNADNFPITAGAYQEQARGTHGYVTRFNEDGSDLVFSTYLGSPYPAQGNETYLTEVCVDNTGRVIAGGRTRVYDWPTTENAFQDTITTQTHSDVVLSILSADGSELIYSTYMGSSYTDNMNDMVFDGDHFIYCCGEGGGGDIDFPTTPDAVFSESGIWGNSYLLRFDLVSLSIDYSTLLPVNEPNSIGPTCLYVVEPGIIWMTGGASATDLPVTPDAIQPERGGDPEDWSLLDGFFSLWDMNRGELTYCSYWGGGDDDTIGDLAVLADSVIVISGGTSSPEYPTTEGVLEPVDTDTTSRGAAFITIVNPYEGIIASTFFGVENSVTWIEKLIADSTGISFFGGVGGYGLPLSAGAFDTLWNDGITTYEDAYVARLSPDLRILEYGSYLGGSGVEQWLGGSFDRNGNAWISGETGSLDLPTTENAFDREYDAVGDGFVLAFQIPDSVISSVRVSPLLPGEFTLSIFPNPFNPSTTISFNLPRRAQTSLEIFNLLGQSVYSIDLGRLEAGSHQHHLNAAALPSGTYLTRLDAGDQQSVKKMVLVR